MLYGHFGKKVLGRSQGSLIHILWLDFGPEIGRRKSSAQITKNYSLNSLIGKKVAAVVNFAPKQIGPIMSECLVLGFPDVLGEVVLISPDQEVPDGGKLF